MKGYTTDAFTALIWFMFLLAEKDKSQVLKSLASQED